MPMLSAIFVIVIPMVMVNKLKQPENLRTIEEKSSSRYTASVYSDTESSLSYTESEKTLKFI